MSSRLTLAAVAVSLMICARLEAAPETTPMELVVIVHADNTAKISEATLESIFLKKERHWSGDSVIIPINAPHDGVSRGLFDRAVLGMSPEESARYWLDVRIRSGETAPRETDDPQLVARLVSKLKSAIAYVPSTTSLTGVRVIARIRKGKIVPP